ncbi:MAG TPA: hypothetical protein VFJ72_10720 [Rubrobacteraceae bacterium]|nr:hypothetical protein [Rubrobacteraceae bacterium]
MAEPARSGEGRRPGNASDRIAERREARKVAQESVYRRRRVLAVCLLVLGVLALVVAVFAGTSGATERAVPIDPNNAGPDTVLAEAAGIDISSPIRPANITGIGYHPEGESLIEMAPRGRNLSSNALFNLFSGGSTPENIQYHMMDPAGRPGFRTGAMDVGAEAGSTVYAPITGTVTAIRPDPMMQGANIVEIKSSEDSDVRVSVSLVRDISEGIGPDKPVKAGMTELGAVADSSKVLTPQLSQITNDAGNHVTVSATRVG